MSVKKINSSLVEKINSSLVEEGLDSQERGQIRVRKTHPF